jgi:FkbM family methyltransferase
MVSQFRTYVKAPSTTNTYHTMNEGITVLPNGQWVITHDTHLSKWAMQHGSIVTDPNLFRFLKPFMDNVSVVWDIGANIGDHTRQYLDWGKTVVAIEPNPLAYECLAHNCPEAFTMNVAASDEAGSLRFMRLDNVGASRVRPDGDIEVPTVVIDNVNEMTSTVPQFVKIDVEGWELPALKGMVGTIAAHRPMIFCEINEGALAGNGVTPRELLDWIKGHLGECATHFYPPKAKLGDPQFDILFVPKKGGGQ